MRDVYVFGDSHWRVFFPFVNHGSPGVTHEQDGIRMIDMVANELSGATMYGLLNDGSKNGARRRILGDLDRLGPVDNVALTFGEVDIRYHNARYFKDGIFSPGRGYELLARFKRFIDEDLILSGRVTKNVFVYFGYRYPKWDQTLLQPGQPIGRAIVDAQCLHDWVYWHAIPVLTQEKHLTLCSVNIKKLYIGDDDVSDDGVHLIPEKVFPEIFSWIKREFNDQNPY